MMFTTKINWSQMWATALVLTLSAGISEAGFFSTSTFTTDAGTGISSSKTYTHAIDLNNGSPATVNGVSFVNGGQTSGPGYTSNWGNSFPAYGTSVTGLGITPLLSNFYYGPPNQTLTLTGLSPGTVYKYTTYVADWGGPTQTMSANDLVPGSLLVDRGTNVAGEGRFISYTYMPLGTSITLTANATSPGDTLHNYGFTNEVVPVQRIFGLYNTGVNPGPGFAGSGPRADNQDELHWTVGTYPDTSTFLPQVGTSANGFPIGPWLGDNSTSAWIGPADNLQSAQAGNVSFSTTFTTAGSGEIFLQGRFAGDNNVTAVLIDNIAQPWPSNGGFTGWTNFQFYTSVVGTSHTLTFVTTSSSIGDFTGLRVEFVPEPGTISLVGLGVAGLIGLRRRVRG